MVDPINCRLLSQERLQEAGVRIKEVAEGVEEQNEGLEEQHEGQLEEWRKEKEGLKKNIARLEARDRRGPLRTQHAVQKALKCGQNPDAAQPVVRYVKDKRGIVRDWARNTKREGVGREDRRDVRR